MSRSASREDEQEQEVVIEAVETEPASLEAAEAEVTVQEKVVEETPPVRHPAAGDEVPFPLADPGEFYIGLWSGHPNYGCPYCGFATLDGSGAVELHILSKIDQGNAKHMKALEKR